MAGHQKQVVHGTVNDAVKIPPPDKSHGSYHWSFERVLAASLVPLAAVPFASGAVSPLLDATLCSLLLVHTHMGFAACITDYFPTREFPKTNRAMFFALYGGTALALYGIYLVETKDVGITETIKKVWTA
ncbi:hypothetical protein CANCADRAFT_28778 [Tortispora caseinolytica NRRL Y-17796]|uniref:Succinate dehydrogenase [ubiquinone] cytochrome b small subunit n=1 Tax=Tortispora caseinolytica NRRL Y-17796 TaxID=767744 RepID=A0A1E4TC20_9ASCO|nr:hypothetical protein CANCADRAFT_28778 [Tortispora caseinolytica NRRL Y-17796]